MTQAQQARARAFLLVALVSLGCSLTLDPQRPQCTADADCAARGSAFESSVCVEGYCEQPECTTTEDCPIGASCSDGSCEGEADSAWTCVGQSEDLTSEQVSFRVPLTDIIYRPMPDITVDVCIISDSVCDTPIDTLVSDEEGLVELTLDRDFDGYLKPRLTDEELQPTLYFLPDPLVHDITLEPFLIVTSALLDDLLRSNGVPEDSSRGHIMVTVVDCQGELAPGVYLEAARADVRSLPFYSNLTPTTDLSETQEGYGIGGFANFPAGTATLDLKLTTTSQTIGRMSLFVRAGVFSQANFNLTVP